MYKIKHWKIIEGNYDILPNSDATWFVDPPSQHGGQHYIFSNKKLSYSSLANWCKNINGQAIVCENTKATWLPFNSLLKKTQGCANTNTTEAVWLNYKNNLASVQCNMF